MRRGAPLSWIIILQRNFIIHPQLIISTSSKGETIQRPTTSGSGGGRECFVSTSWHAVTRRWPCCAGDPCQAPGSSGRPKWAHAAPCACGRRCTASWCGGLDGWPCAAGPPVWPRRTWTQSPVRPSRSWGLGVPRSISLLSPAQMKWM